MYNTTVLAWMPDANEELPVRFEYRISAPHAVTLRIDTRAETHRYRTWTFSRDLLASGLFSTGWVGDGDVAARRVERVWPDGSEDQHLELWLGTPEAQAVFHLPVTGIARWLGRTLTDLPVGMERARVDDTVAAIEDEVSI